MALGMGVLGNNFFQYSSGDRAAWLVKTNPTYKKECQNYKQINQNRKKSQTYITQYIIKIKNLDVVE